MLETCLNINKCLFAQDCCSALKQGQFDSFQNSGEEKIYFPDEHEVEKTEEGQHNLVIKNAKLVDGGRYSCDLVSPIGYSKDVSLVVIGKFSVQGRTGHVGPLF